MLARQRAPDGQRDKLRVPYRRLANRAVAQQRTHELAAEDIAEQPAARRRWLDILARIPFAQLDGFLCLTGLVLLCLRERHADVALDFRLSDGFRQAMGLRHGEQFVDAVRL